MKRKIVTTILSIFVISIMSVTLSGCFEDELSLDNQLELLPSTGDMTDSSLDNSLDIEGIDRKLRNKVSFKDAKVLPKNINELKVKYEKNNYKTSLIDNVLTCISKKNDNIKIKIKYIENGDNKSILKSLYNEKKLFLDSIDELNSMINREKDDAKKIELLKVRNIYQRVFDYSIVTNQGNYYIYGHVDAYDIFIK